jgi:hypothetical protein
VYAKARGDGQVYTPQVVINGGMHVNGSDRSAIERGLTSSGLGQSRLSAPLSISRESGHLVVQVAGDTRRTDGQELSVWLAAVKRQVEVAVRRGENAGKTLAYTNVVRDATMLGMWNGQPMATKLDPAMFAQSEADAVAVVLQRGMAGPIAGAAWADIK